MSTPKRPADFEGGDVIRDAACIVVIDEEGAEPKLLMGRRHADQIFLPNKWVFPGGRVDDDDRQIAAGYPLKYQPVDLAGPIRPFALAAIRELEEEAGVVLGDAAAPQDFSTFCEARRLPCRRFPRTAGLMPLARAITPPGRVRRYDTWFFTARTASAQAIRGPVDGELTELGWFTVSGARDLDLPHITRLVLDEVVLHSTAEAAGQVPFYRPDSSGFTRTYTSCRNSNPMP